MAPAGGMVKQAASFSEAFVSMTMRSTRPAQIWRGIIKVAVLPARARKPRYKAKAKTGILVVHNAHIINLKGDTMRKKLTKNSRNNSES